MIDSFGGVRPFDPVPHSGGSGILREWVSALGLRHQGLILTAIRGCDDVPREDSSKWLTRFYRACVLRAHCGDPNQARSFMVWTDDPGVFWANASPFIRSHDHYPHHFLMHLLHAAEVVGYKMPRSLQQQWWQTFYVQLAGKFHLGAESEADLDRRLNADEQTFAKLQDVDLVP